jgi:hypothetical protein
MTAMSCLLTATLFAQATATRPIAVAKPEAPTAQESHAKVLPSEIGLLLLGSYDLDRPWSNGEKAFYYTIADDKPQLRIGQDERRLIYESRGLEESGGVKTDVYSFTVVGMPGVTLRFKVSGGKVTYVAIFDDFATPPMTLTGKPKRR